jgi:hypothetical protein
LLCVFIVPCVSEAHRFTRAKLTIDLEGAGAGELALELRGRLRTFSPLLGLGWDRRIPTPANYRARQARLLHGAATHLSIYDGGRRLCRPIRRELVADTKAVRLRLRYRCPAALAHGAPLELRYDLMFATDPDHRVVVALRGAAGKSRLTTLDTKQRTVRFSRRLTRGAALWRFFRLGNHHIIEGIDHILFLLALLLAAPLRGRPREEPPIEGAEPPRSALRGGLLYLLTIVSAFTVAHSLTLAACALGWVQLPSKLVESAIALSIVWVALENVLWPRSRLRVPLVFAFGLLHGFGFAHVLGETGLPPAQLVGALLAFNIGVEAGQLLIVAAAFPLLYGVERLLTRRGVDRYRFVLWGGSALIGACGVYWLVTRLAG